MYYCRVFSPYIDPSKLKLTSYFSGHRRRKHDSPIRGEVPKVVQKRQKNSENKISGSLNGISFAGTINASNVTQPSATITSTSKQTSNPQPNIKKIAKSFINQQAEENSASASSEDEAALEDGFEQQFK